MGKRIELSVILPCRNEEKALPECLKTIKQVLKENNINGEIIVSDSSWDSSPKIAKQHEVRLIKHDKEGYGNAYLEAIKEAKGEYLFMADADGSYDFKEIPKFLQALKEGKDLVIGNRLEGNIEKEAMPWHHQYLGNPFLSSILRLFFKAKVKDAHSGMRAIRRKDFQKLNLRTTGMEFASEMIIKATKLGLKIKEMPINYYKRKGHSKLKSFSDGWRHLRFMLLYAPKFLFFIPGIIFLILGLLSFFLIYLGIISFLGITFVYHPLFLSSALIIVGYQLVIFSLFAESYALNHLQEKRPLIEKVCRKITLERAGILSIVSIILGSVIYLSILMKWINAGFGELQEAKNSLLALTLIVLGIQTLSSAFMLSILSIKEK
ncbi:MAG: glycosyltransferase [Nanoarchaeota archaeon]|nr:glycosyltransferase [Nanoarchaeota archaeon]